MRQYSVSLLLWQGQPFDEVIADVAAAGFKACELRQQDLDLETSGGVDRVQRVLAQHDVHALTLHTTPRDISQLDDDARRAAVDEVSAGFGALGELRGFAAIVHPCQPLESTTADPAPRIDAFRRSLAVLSERAHRAGIRVACENLPSMAGEPPRPLSLMDDLRAVIDDFPPNVGVCLDTGHAVLNGRSPIDEARVAGDRLIALHLHDADAQSDHWTPGDRSIDWAGLNTALADISFEGAWTFEHARAAWQDGALQEARRARVLADAWGSGRP